MKDQIIPLDSEIGTKLGFTSDKFQPYSYLWLDGDRIMISVIASKQPGRGYLSQLFKSIEDMGYRVAVPTPFPHMQEILQRKGFEMHTEYDDVFEDNVEIWEKPRG